MEAIGCQKKGGFVLHASVIDLPAIKVDHRDIEVEYSFSISHAAERSANDISAEIQAGLQRVEREILAGDDQTALLDKEIDRLTNHADNVDNLVAVGSGLLAGLVDILWVGEFDFQRGKAWSNRRVNDFVMKVAKAQGFEGERLDEAIRSLEEKFPIPSDNIWSGKDLGISSKSHHLDDLAHHPTPLGLFFSILTRSEEHTSELQSRPHIV